MEERTQKFLDAFASFKDKSDWKFSIQIYHNDESSQHFFCAQVDVERVLLDYVDGDFIITIHTEDSSYSFSSSNWLAYVDSGYVSFGSSFDEKTHCIIEYC